MTAVVDLRLGGFAPGVLGARQLLLAAGAWLAAAGTVTLGPLVAFWAGWQVIDSGHPSMAAICVVLGVLAAVDYGLVALVRQLALARERLPTIAEPGVAAGSALRRPGGAPLVLVDVGDGSRPWREVAPQLGFGFDVLVAVLTRDGSLAGTLRAMDRAGWGSAHVVARGEDGARAAVELARLGRARSLHLLDADDASAGDAGTVAAEIAERVALRPRG